MLLNLYLTTVKICKPLFLTSMWWHVRFLALNGGEIIQEFHLKESCNYLTSFQFNQVGIRGGKRGIKFDVCFGSIIFLIALDKNIVNFFFQTIYLKLPRSTINIGFVFKFDFQMILHVFRFCILLSFNIQTDPLIVTTSHK